MKRRWSWLLALVVAAQAGCQSAPWSSWWGQTAQRKSPAANAADMAPADAAGVPLVSAETRIDVMMAAGRSFETEHKYADAANVYEKVLQRDPRQAKACHRLAVVHDRQGRPDTAAALYEKALALAPRNAAVHCDYGYSCYLRENWSEAERHLLAAIELQPNLRRAHANLGLVWAKTGRENDALQAFANAGLSEAEARNNLGFALSVNQHLDQAAAQYAAAVQLDPNLPQARQSSQQLDKVRNRVQTNGPVVPASYESPAARLREAAGQFPEGFSG